MDTTTAAAPCPAWCIYSAGHAFELDTVSSGPSGFSGLSRRHGHPVRWLQWSHDDGSMPAVALWMSQVEQAAVAGGPAHSRPVEIVVEGCADTRLTGPQARQLAAALGDAADLWDAAHAWTLAAAPALVPALSSLR